MQSGYQPECERFNILIHLWPFLLIVAGEHSKISVLYIEFCVFCFSLCKKNVELSVHNIQICCWLVMLFVSHSFDWINLIISCAYASGRNKKKTEEEMMWCMCLLCAEHREERWQNMQYFIYLYIGIEYRAVCMSIDLIHHVYWSRGWTTTCIHFIYIYFCVYFTLFTQREKMITKSKKI